MDRQAITDVVQTPDKAARKMGYSIDWSTNQSVRDSLMKMDVMTYAIVKTCIEHSASTLDSLTKEELEQAGITLENLLQVAGGLTND